MRRDFWIAAGTMAAILVSAASDSAADKPARVLMVTQSAGFVHGSVKRKEGKLAASEIAMTQLGQQTGLFEVHCTQDCKADFTKDNLANYDIVMFYTTGKLPIAEADMSYFLDEWLRQPGHGFIGFHSATDTYKNFEPYWDMIGGSFNGHPWNAGNTVTITVHEPDHPAMKPFGAEFQIRDEIYQYSHWQPEKVRVLMSLNMAKCEPKKPYHVPVAWVKSWGQGRVFVNNLGHNETTWTDKRFLESVTGGVRWILGKEDGESSPNPDVSATEVAKAKKGSGVNSPLILTEIQRAAGAVFANDSDAEPPVHFGAATEEYNAATTGCALIDSGPRTQIEVRGADRSTFLHNFCTNDINRLQPGHGCEAFLTNVKARMLGYVNVFVGEEAITLESAGGAAEAIVAHLDRYVITEDVQLIDRSTELAQFVVAGAESPAFVDRELGCDVARFEPFAHQTVDAGGQQVSVRRCDLGSVPGVLLSFERNGAAGLWERLAGGGAEPAGLVVFHALRIEAGIPVYGVDLDDEMLAPEAGRTPFAISYSKGCYLGQEPIARIDSMGHVNRELCGVRFESDTRIPVGTAVRNNSDDEVGAIRSSASVPGQNSTVAMALLNRSATAAGTSVQVQPADTTIPGTVFQWRG